MGFRPLHDWVLIKRSKPEEKTSSGIIIPDAARTKSTEGIVEAIGPGKFEQEKGKDKKEKKFVPTVLKPGQRVMFIDYMTKEIVLDGKEITIIQEDNILGVFESSGAVAVKEQYHVEVKKDHPPMVQAEKAKAVTRKTFETEVTFRKAVKKGKAIKQVKAEVKTNTKKTTAQGKENKMKKTVKKVVAKKTAPAKKAVAKKTVKKAVVKKAIAKKVAPKKAVAKKSAPKKTVVKKTVTKKAAAKKVVAKKSVKKTAAKKK
jgi:co-chaperonin GroES (HSP10)